MPNRQPSQRLPEAPSLLAGIKALELQIRAAADRIEEERCLPDDLVEALRATGLFRATWPRSMGGLELDPLTQIEALEELSRYDGAVGWVGTFAAISGLLAAHLDPVGAKELFASPDVVSAGSYGPMGRAERVEGGYRVNGKWSFGSGCRHSDVMSAGCFVTVNGEINRLADGQPEYRVAMFPKSSAAVDLGSWQVSGMRGTGSHDYRLTDLFVPERHTFDDLDPPHHPGPLYAFAPLFLYSHVTMPLGIARSAMDYIYALGDSKKVVPAMALLKEHGDAHEAVAKAEAALRSARSWVYDVIGDLWETLCRGDAPSAEQRSLFRLCQVHVTHVAKDVVLQMYDVAGSSAIQQKSPIDRLLRDIMTVSAHRIVQTRMYRPSGKMLFGLEVKNDRLF
ncbi:MAG: putative hydroxylase [Alphaproteobacteria bacterium]|nr:putative hydroxylase [Alphaproteobacteria bacterium]